MKTLMTLALVFVAAGASAQAPGMDRNLNTRAARLEQEKAMVAPPEKNKNKIVGRALGRAGLWRMLWR